MKFSIKIFFSKWKTSFFVQCAKLTWVKENQFNSHFYITQIHVSDFFIFRHRLIVLPLLYFVVTALFFLQALFCCCRFIFSLILAFCYRFILLPVFYFFVDVLFFFSILFFYCCRFIFSRHCSFLFPLYFAVTALLLFFLSTFYYFLFLDALFCCYCLMFSRHFSFLSLLYLFAGTDTVKEIQNDKEKEVARNW